jgi:phosphotriesterase-related protein
MNGVVDTVLGPVTAAELGPTLIHEHLFVDARTPAQREESRHRDPLALHNYYLARRNDDNPHCLVLDSVGEAADELRHFAGAGGRTLVEVTPICLGRQPARLAEVSRASGVNVVMGGGFYDHEYHDARVHEWPVEQLTELIVSDCVDGVPSDRQGVAVKAGVIGEIGLSWPMVECERKALVAASRAQARTGRALIIHPGRHPAAPREALEVASSAGADPARVVMSHLDRTLDDPAAVAELARAGAFVSFDLFGHESSFYPYSDFAMPNDAMRLKLIRAVADLGFDQRIVVSQDVYSKAYWVRYGCEGYAHILRDVVPVMDRFGIDETLRLRLLVENPARAIALPADVAALARERRPG